MKPESKKRLLEILESETDNYFFVGGSADRDLTDTLMVRRGEREGLYRQLRAIVHTDDSLLELFAEVVGDELRHRRLSKADKKDVN